MAITLSILDRFASIVKWFCCFPSVTIEPLHYLLNLSFFTLIKLKLKFQLNFYIQSTLNCIWRPHAYLQRSVLCGNVVKSCGMDVVDKFFWRWVLSECGLYRPRESLWIDSNDNKNSSGDEIANVNFFYNIAHVEASAYANWTSS